MTKETSVKEESKTGDNIVVGLLIFVAILPIIIAVIVGVRSVPNTCIVNEKQERASIEVRNYETSRRRFEEEHGFRINSEGVWEGYSQPVERYEPASFEWRYVGTEDWVHESVDPVDTENEKPCRLEVSHDVQVCDGRPEHAENNGKVQETYRRVEFHL